MMQGLTLNSDAPLYGRASEILAIRPIAAGHIGEALGISEPLACAKAFAVFGGIPRYWELAERFGPDVAAAVDGLILDPMGPLHLEPDAVLSEETPPALSLRPLLDCIGAGAHRPSEIASRLGQPATSLGRPLGRLIQLGLVRKEQPFGDSERGGKRTLYRIADPFFRIWFRLVAPRRGLLASATPAVRQRIWRREAAAVFAEAWELMCRDAVPGLPESHPVLGRHGPFGPAGRLWGGDTPEWDVVALSEDGGLLLGEVKWQDGEASSADLDRAVQALARKGLPVSKELRDCRVIRAVFFPRVAPAARKAAHPVAVVDAEDVLGALR
jgi:hypothetical protein